MALQTVTSVNVDFYEKKYILINAKQLDKQSRFLSVTCYNNGESCPLDSNQQSAYVRYKKPDNYSVFNTCTINTDGTVLVELTEQMLASGGICYVDLVIVDAGNAKVDTATGEITNIENAPILSTMMFCIDVSETAVENSEIELSYEFNGLNEALQKAEAEYTEVIQLSKSYAVGNVGGIRENEDTDNAKYYYEQSSVNANTSTTNATNAANSATQAATSEANAKTYMNNAKTYMNSAKTSETNASTSATSASTSETATKGYATTAQNSMNSAVNSATSASASATEAYNYYLQAEAIVNGLNGAFLPMGTITFSELSTLKENGTVGTGYLYNISDNFTTDDTFKSGAGVEYPAGSNVYYTADGYWDILASATVIGVKGSAETAYRTGNVDISAENVGAVAATDVATVDEVKNYLGIA